MTEHSDPESDLVHMKTITDDRLICLTQTLLSDCVNPSLYTSDKYTYNIYNLFNEIIIR